MHGVEFDRWISSFLAVFAHCVEFAITGVRPGKENYLLTYLLSLRKSALYVVSLSVFCL